MGWWMALAPVYKALIGAGVAAAGAAATHQANKKAAAVQYRNALAQQNAQNAQIKKQKDYDNRMATFVAQQAATNKDKVTGLSEEMQALFNASLDRQNISEQEDIANKAAARNDDTLQKTVSTEPMYLGGQEQAAPEVKQAITKEAASVTSQMRARVAALARFGAEGRDRNLTNNRANATTMAKIGLLGNQMRGANDLLGVARGMRPATAYYEPPKIEQQGNDAGLLKILGATGSALGGYAMGAGLAGMAGGTGAGAANTIIPAPPGMTMASLNPALPASAAGYSGVDSIIGGYQNPGFHQWPTANNGWR